MIVNNEKKKDDTVYPYFVCAGQHSKRKPDCTTKAVLIDVVEKKIEEIYDTYQLPAEVRTILKEQVSTLEAHYNNAVPLDLLKTEQ